MDLDTPPTAVIDAKSNSLIKILAVVFVIAVLAIITFFVLSKKPESKLTQNSQKTATASTASNSACGTGQEYLNEKQGYQVCTPSGAKSAELSTSAMLVGFGSQTLSSDYPGDISIQISDSKIDVLVQDTTNNSSKFEYSNSTIDGVKGTQVIYTRAKTDPLYTGHKQAIDTFLNHFGRTYTIRLNTNSETLEADEKTYNDFLASFQFISGTANPPWSDSRNILVYSPWTNDKVTNPIHLSGAGTAFEGVINIRVKDSAGHVLVQSTTQTESGNERSAFSANVTFEKPSSKNGTLEVYTSSPMDGSEQDKVSIPIIFP